MKTVKIRFGVSGIPFSPATIFSMLSIVGTYTALAQEKSLQPSNVSKAQFDAGILAGSSAATYAQSLKDRKSTESVAEISLPESIATNFAVFCKGVLPELMAAKDQLFRNPEERQAFEAAADQMIKFAQAIEQSTMRRETPRGALALQGKSPVVLTVITLAGADPAAVANTARMLGLVGQPAYGSGVINRREDWAHAPAFASVQLLGVQVEFCAPASARPSQDERPKVLAAAHKVVTTQLPALFARQAAEFDGQRDFAVVSQHGYTIRFTSTNNSPLTVQRFKQICADVGAELMKPAYEIDGITVNAEEPWGTLTLDFSPETDPVAAWNGQGVGEKIGA
jgi:hypothetical protein